MKRRIHLLLGGKTRGLLLLGLFSSLLSGQDLKDFEKRVTEFTLNNGMHFIVLERHEAPVVSFDAFVNAGAVDDPAGASSMAHMFEHMIGKGTETVGSKNWPKEREALAAVELKYDRLEVEERKGRNADPKKMERLEADLKGSIESANSFVVPNLFTQVISENGGSGFNAGTGQDNTSYFYSLPANRIELWFRLQSEWFRQPVFREFYKERDVVREERRMRVESDAQGKLQELLMATSFMAHPYRNMIGWASEIEHLRAKEAQEFFKKYYVPGNITLAVVGDVNPAQIRQFAEKYYGRIPGGPLPPPVSIVEPEQEGEKRAALESDSQPLLMIAYKRPNQNDKDDPVFDVISGILSSGRTGLLYKNLVRDQQVAIEAETSATVPAGKYPNLFLFYSAPTPGHTVEENEKAIYKLLDDLKKNKVNVDTLSRVKNKIRTGLLQQLDSNSGLASQLTYYHVEYGDWRVMFTGIEDINRVTADDVQRVIRQYFTERGRSVTYITAAKTSQEPGAAARPEGGK